MREHFRRSYGGLRLRSFMRPQVCEVEFDRLVALKPYDFVSCPDLGGGGAVVEDCHSHDGHVRGILLKSSDSVVARCRFERIARSGLVASGRNRNMCQPCTARSETRRTETAVPTRD